MLPSGFSAQDYTSEVWVQPRLLEIGLSESISRKGLSISVRVGDVLVSGTVGLTLRVPESGQIWYL